MTTCMRCCPNICGSLCHLLRSGNCLFHSCVALDARRVSEIGIAYFVCYLLVNILANFLTYGFGLFDSGTRSRLVSPEVVSSLGYTITLMMGFTLLNRGGLHNLRVFLYMCILAVGSIFTGSRASVWPMVSAGSSLFHDEQARKVQLTRCVLLLQPF